MFEVCNLALHNNMKASSQKVKLSGSTVVLGFSAEFSIISDSHTVYGDSRAAEAQQELGDSRPRHQSKSTETKKNGPKCLLIMVIKASERAWRVGLGWAASISTLGFYTL